MIIRPLNGCSAGSASDHSGVKDADHSANVELRFEAWPQPTTQDSAFADFAPRNQHVKTGRLPFHCEGILHCDGQAETWRNPVDLFCYRRILQVETSFIPKHRQPPSE